MNSNPSKLRNLQEERNSEVVKTNSNNDKFVNIINQSNKRKYKKDEKNDKNDKNGSNDKNDKNVKYLRKSQVKGGIGRNQMNIYNNLRNKTVQKELKSEFIHRNNNYINKQNNKVSIVDLKKHVSQEENQSIHNHKKGGNKINQESNLPTEFEDVLKKNKKSNFDLDLNLNLDQDIDKKGSKKQDSDLLKGNEQSAISQRNNMEVISKKDMPNIIKENKLKQNKKYDNSQIKLMKCALKTESNFNVNKMVSESPLISHSRRKSYSISIVNSKANKVQKTTVLSKVLQSQVRNLNVNLNLKKRKSKISPLNPARTADIIAHNSIILKNMKESDKACEEHSLNSLNPLNKKNYIDKETKENQIEFSVKKKKIDISNKDKEKSKKNKQGEKIERIEKSNEKHKVAEVNTKDKLGESESAEKAGKIDCPLLIKSEKLFMYNLHRKACLEIQKQYKGIIDQKILNKSCNYFKKNFFKLCKDNDQFEEYLLQLKNIIMRYSKGAIQLNIDCQK